MYAILHIKAIYLGTQQNLKFEIWVNKKWKAKYKRGKQFPTFLNHYKNQSLVKECGQFTRISAKTWD